MRATSQLEESLDHPAVNEGLLIYTIKLQLMSEGGALLTTLVRALSI